MDRDSITVLDRAGRRQVIELTEKTWNPTIPLRRRNRTYGHHLRRTEREPIVAYSYHWSDAVSRVLRPGFSMAIDHDDLGRAIRRKEEVGADRYAVRIEVAYDANDRVIRKEMPGRCVQTFEYDDVARTMGATFENGENNSKIVNEYQVDWRGHLLHQRSSCHVALSPPEQT